MKVGSSSKSWNSNSPSVFLDPLAFRSNCSWRLIFHGGRDESAADHGGLRTAAAESVAAVLGLGGSSRDSPSRAGGLLASALPELAAADDRSVLVDTDRSTAACPAAATAAVISWIRLVNGLLLGLGASSVALAVGRVADAFGLLLGATSAPDASLGAPSLLGAALGGAQSGLAAREIPEVFACASDRDLGCDSTLAGVTPPYFAGRSGFGLRVSGADGRFDDDAEPCAPHLSRCFASYFVLFFARYSGSLALLSLSFA